MNSDSDLDDNARFEADRQFMDALLERTLRPDDEADEQRIQRVLADLASDSPSQDFNEPQVGTTRRRRWSTLVLVATVLIGVRFWWQMSDPARQAHAAVERSLQRAESTGPRHYQIVTQLRGQVIGEKVLDADLFLDGKDHFVLRHPGPLGLADFWIGGNDRECWVVPPQGPVLTGDRQVVREWMDGQSDVTTPVLHLTTLLQRMSRDYDLTLLPEEELTDALHPGHRVICQRVRGELRDHAKKTRLQPRIIELWADRATGLARQVELDWQHSETEYGVSHVSLELTGTPELKPSWFEHTAHHEGRPFHHLPNE